jgi:hypothetical protein
MEHTRPACAAAAMLALAAPSLAAAQVPPTPPPPPATPAAVTLDATCYTPGDPVTASGSGFTPGSQVSETLALLSGTNPLGTLMAPVITVGPDGTFKRSLKAPDLMSKIDRRETAMSAFADQADPQGKSAFVQWTLSRWDLNIPEWNNSRIAQPRRKMTVDAIGWTSLGPTLYAHYFRGQTKVKSVKLGALTGDCKDLKTRVRQFPFKNVKPGRWTVYFSTTAVFDKGRDAYGFYRTRVPKS